MLNALPVYLVPKLCRSGIFHPAAACGIDSLAVTMTPITLTWDEYTQHVRQDLLQNGAFAYRGQRDAAWTLRTTLHRTTIVGSIADHKSYADLVVPRVHEAIEAWAGKSWNLADSLGLAEFLAFLQHNGFPTPLLDWTFSPYIAAYFAYESLNHFAPQSEYVAIYSFNARKWTNSFKQIYDFADFTPHVSVLRPRMIGNHKLSLQQGCFTWTNVPDLEEHIRLNERDGQKFLVKYQLPSVERPRVMTELSLMGISAVQLMPSIESVCKKALEDLIGLTPLEPGR